MSDNTPPTPGSATDGSTDVTEEQRKYTENLGDGSPSGDETKDPNADTDHASGGDPDDE